MQHYPPVPIYMHIESQEKRSGIPDLPITMPKIRIEVMPLHMGDYDIGGDPCRVLERKTASIFLSAHRAYEVSSN
jgi:ERCC4-type nuclease